MRARPLQQRGPIAQRLRGWHHSGAWLRPPVDPPGNHAAAAAAAAVRRRRMAPAPPRMAVTLAQVHASPPPKTLQEEEDVYDKVCDTWVQSRNATLEQQVRLDLNHSMQSRAALAAKSSSDGSRVLPAPNPLLSILTPPLNRLLACACCWPPWVAGCSSTPSTCEPQPEHHSHPHRLPACACCWPPWSAGCSSTPSQRSRLSSASAHGASRASTARRCPGRALLAAARSCWRRRARRTRSVSVCARLNAWGVQRRRLNACGLPAGGPRLHAACKQFCTACKASPCSMLMHVDAWGSASAAWEKPRPRPSHTPTTCAHKHRCAEHRAD